MKKWAIILLLIFTGIIFITWLSGEWAASCQRRENEARNHEAAEKKKQEDERQSQIEAKRCKFKDASEEREKLLGFLDRAETNFRILQMNVSDARKASYTQLQEMRRWWEMFIVDRQKDEDEFRACYPDPLLVNYHGSYPDAFESIGGLENRIEFLAEDYWKLFNDPSQLREEQVEQTLKLFRADLKRAKIDLQKRR